VDPRSSPLGAFGEENSPTRPTSLPPTAIRDDHIDPRLLQLSPTGPALPMVQSPAAHRPPPATTRTVTETSAHPLTSFSAARPPFIYDTFLSGTATNTPSAVNALANAGATSTLSSVTSRAITAQPTPHATSPRRSLAATSIIASLTADSGSVSIPASTPVSADSTAATPPVSLPAGVETRPARKPATATLPKDLVTQSRGRRRGRGRGGRGRGGRGRGGRGGGVAKENFATTTDDATSSNPDPDVHQVQLLSAASRHRIDALNKRVYPPDGATPGPPLGTSHSINVDGMYPAITFQALPPAAAPKKRSRDGVSEADIVSGKRARKERVRVD
jgi:hypothetical protein